MARSRRRARHLSAFRAGTSAFLSIAAASLALPACAQEAPQAQAQATAGLEVITVTARKQTEDLQSTPISITAFSAERLEAQGITQINRIQDFTPNLTFANVPSNSGIASNAAVYIRGIGQSDFAPTTEPGVGIYIDGVYLGRTAGGVFDLIDVASVEVLRGPQGTLFGRNTVGGAINLTTIQPDETLRVKADAKYGTDNLVNLRAMISGPLTEGLYAKISGGLFSQDGYVDAPELGTTFGNKDSKMVRGALRFAPVGSRLDVTLAADYTRDKSNGAPVVVTGMDPNAMDGFAVLNNLIASGMTDPGYCLTPAQANNTACYNSRLFSRDTNYSTGETFSDLELWSASLTVSYDLTDEIEVKSISAWRRINGTFAQDRDGSNLDINYVYDDFKQKQFSQELQLVGSALDGRLNWVTGLYYFTESGRDINPIDFLVVHAQSGGYYDYENWAGFAQLGYEVVDGLTLTGGLRYTDDKKSFLPDQYVIEGLAPFVTLPPGTRLAPYEWADNNVQKWTPMVNASWEATPDLMLYATYSQGFKGGGYTQRVFPPEESLPSFRPETVDSYEAGFKLMALNNMLRLNGSAYYADYNDMQLLVADATRVGPFFTNAGKARIQGFELETNFAPGNGIRLNAALGLTDADYKELNEGVQGLTLDSKFVFVSKWTASASGEKDFDLGTSGTLTPHVDWSYRSGFFTNANGINTPELYQPGYSLFNANLRWRDADEHLSLTLGIDNIGDKKFRIFGDYQPSFGFFMQGFDRGRQYYAKIGYAF
ncbi:TonB-dependent receptor [Novosphingobium mangrovi (ex Hu et al. 2023)]|uniref:TonB-dependent receptor n=1 Tax=Novosphingobium mangrovi (ex Hu et al. 2023) TaxID=2930094 RepID=A0ABT0AE50_9SPHN|nr:TonB-dependent receptor [Novosphingobium mangrovi (ex Hu et al. 2023)]MCJ1961480.1 TonB-dependent receptor [Novosphingobium mangrovi (ex Hu et al. 2023)]